MKDLLLLRHAKSSWDDKSLDDYDRPLNGRGERAAPQIGMIMRERQVVPDIVLCSPAKRTRQTARLALGAAQGDAEIIFDDRIYLAAGFTLMEVLSQLSRQCQVALLIGHNPGLEDLLESLTGSSYQMPTAALAFVRLEVKSWNNLCLGSGELLWLVKPKDILG